MAHSIDSAVYRAAKSQFYAPSPNEQDHTFILKNGLELCVASGDITMVEAAAVVVGEDTELSGRGAVAQRLIKVGGKEYRDNREFLKNHMRETGYRCDVYSCPAGSKLKFHQVFHALTTHSGGKGAISCWDSHMKNLFFQIGILAENNKAETVATPLLGAGAAGGSLDESLEGLVDGLQCIDSKIFLKVILVEYDSKRASDMKEKLRQILDRKRKKAQEEAEKAEHNKGCRIPGKGPYETSAVWFTGTDEGWNDQQGSKQTSGQEAWPRNRVTEDGGRGGANYGEPSNLDLFNSTSNDRSGHKDHSFQVDSLAGAQGPNNANTQKEIFTKLDPKIINSITSTTRLIESRSQHNNPDTQMETDYRDGGLRRNSTSSRTNSTTGEGTPADEVTQQGGRRAMNSEVPRQGFGDRAEPEKDPDNSYENARKWAESSRNKNSSPHNEREGERGDDFQQDKESFRGNDETSSEKEDKDKYTNVDPSSPRDGQTGRDERKIARARSSSSKDGLTKCGTSPKIVHMSSDEDGEGEDEDKDDKGEGDHKDEEEKGEGEDNDEDEVEDKDEVKDEESSSASPDQGGRGHGKGDEDKDYKEPTIHYPPPSIPQTGPPKITMWSSSQLPDEADKNADPSDNSSSFSNTDADHSEHLSQDSQSYHGDQTFPTSAEDESNHRGRGSFSNTQESFQPKPTPDEASQQRRNATGEAEEEAFKEEAQARASEKPNVKRREPGPESVGGGSNAEGKMHTDVKPHLQLDGFSGCGTILIEYSFPNGVQGDKHSSPGQPYKGTFRRAFLPDNEEGQRVVGLLQEAFDRKLTFQLVQAGPTGEWGVEFTDIPHKTSLRGGPDGNGYPDADYLRTVLEKLRLLGLH